MRLLSTLPTAMAMPGASASTDNPLALAKVLWDPELQENPGLLRDQLNDSIARDMFPTGREEIIQYLGQQHPKTVRRALEQYKGMEDVLPNVTIRGLHHYYEMKAALWNATTIKIRREDNLWRRLFSELGVDDVLTLVRDSYLMIADLIFPRVETLMALIMRPRNRPETWQSLLNKQDDHRLICKAAILAAYKGSRELENHFNALVAHNEYRLGLEGEPSINRAQRQLHDLAYYRGSLHAYHYSQLLTRQGYVNKGPVKELTFQTARIENELAGDKVARDINLIGAITDTEFRKAYFDYLDSTKLQPPESSSHIDDIVERLIASAERAAAQ